MYSPGNLIYEGKAKKIFDIVGEASLIIHEFKDSLTAFNGEKKGDFKDKGVINQKMSALLFERLETSGIRTHFVESLSDCSFVSKKLEMIPLEVVVRNIAAGSLVKRLGFSEGVALSPPLVELYLKDDSLGDPFISVAHALRLEIADVETISSLEKTALDINKVLKAIFSDGDMDLVDFKLEFGTDSDGNLFLADEISPDTCRLWDRSSGEKLDKDRFRFDLGDVSQGYKKVFERITQALES